MQRLKKNAHLLVFVLALCAASSCLIDHASAKPFAQKCSGYLVIDPDSGLQLAKTPKGGNFDGVSWCDASIEGELRELVLKTCSVGGTCKISGFVEGHGTFSWTKITQISR